MGYLSQKAEELERKKYSLEKNLEHKNNLKERKNTPKPCGGFNGLEYILQSGEKLSSG